MGDQRRGGIAWTDETLNPIRARHRVTGKVGWYCQRVSDGCKFCYAATMNEWRGNGVDYTVPNLDAVEIYLDESVLTAPLRWRRPRRVFVCSMTDLFADFVPDEWIDRVVKVIMVQAAQHTFQILTKRPERMRRYLSARPYLINAETNQSVEWPAPHIWWGVSVESRQHLDRLDLLRQTPAAVRFVSFEPLLEDLSDVDLRGIDQAIYGGESGPNARPCDLAWIRRGIACCRKSATKPFVKQLGAHAVEDWTPNEGGVRVGFGMRYRDRAGADPAEWPEDLRVREWPR